jgi:Spy/CpxP family protein refolding chaperone
MKKAIIILGLVAVMLLGVTYVYAKSQGFGPGRMGEHHWKNSNCGMWSTLTPEQKTKFEELRQKFVEETAQLRGNLLTRRLELQSLWANPKADSKAIAEKEKGLRDLQNQMRDKTVQNMLEVSKLLTPEQLAEFGPGCGMGSGFDHGCKMGHGYEEGHRGQGRGMRQ